ncbi:MAG: TonB-dependent receptor [Bacteroidales bacterium]|jgi:TonB-linked SusC/RagA family outer membrane protein|nr:TonB-dependent receptor [Bacteroidales bacterium]
MPVLARQGIPVTGTVTDESETPLPGVNVVVEGTATGVITDRNGKYSIRVPDRDAVLVFSFVGYGRQEIIVGDHSVISVVLSESSHVLDEVVVVGYGTVSRKNITGAVSSITGNDIRMAPISDVTQSLSGKVAGVQIIRSQGSPDADISIKIRGGTSITQSNEPLYIIDGFPIEDGLKEIEAGDIESIDILKDASSTAIYGARGANGVVLVTTKSGKKNQLNISYDMYYGVKKITKELKVLAPEDFVLLEYERFLYDAAGMANIMIPYYGNFDEYHTLYAERKGINWQQEVFEKHRTSTQQHKFSIDGGDENTRYFFTFTRNADKGIWYKSGLTRNNFRAKINQKASSWLQLSAGVSYTDEATTGITALQEGGYFSKMQHVVQYRPIMGKAGDDTQLLIDDQDPILLTEGSSQTQSPLASIEGETNDKRNRILNINGDVEIKIFPWLSYRGSAGVRKRMYNNDVFYDVRSKQAKNAGTPYGHKSVTDDESFMFNNVLTFNRELGQHQLTVLAGQELLKQDSRYLRTGATGFPEQHFGLNDMSLASVAEIPETVNKNEKLLSFFGRFNYGFRNKYLLTASLRTDGSTKFGKNHKWGYFPSASFAWRLSEENFMQQQTVFSDAKLRLSYGIAGNNRIPNYLSLSRMGSLWIPEGQGIEAGFASKQLQNPDLRWEKNITANLGIDFALLKGRLQLTVDLYNTDTDDLLLEAPVPMLSGYASTMVNAGATRNRGIELSLTSHNIVDSHFRWTTTLNLSHNKNTVQALYKTDYREIVSEWAVLSEFNKSDYIIRVGEPLGQMYGYVLDGIYVVNDFNYNAGTSKYEVKDGVPYDPAYYPEPGSWKFRDIAGENEGEISFDDKTVIGNAIPDLLGGITNTIVYKGFDLNIFLNFSIGNDIYSANKMYYTKLNNKHRNSLDLAKNRFSHIDAQGNNIFNDPQRLAEINEGKTLASVRKSSDLYFHSGYVEDGSFLKINTVSLGYTLPKTWTGKIHISAVRFYLTAYNLHTFTKYAGYDPEVNTVPNSGLTPGIDWGAYPSAKTYVFGANITF